MKPCRVFHMCGAEPAVEFVVRVTSWTEYVPQLAVVDQHIQYTLSRRTYLSGLTSQHRLDKRHPAIEQCRPD